MKSLWTPSVRWTGVTEEGLDGGPVIPDDYDGSPASLAAGCASTWSAPARSASWWRQLQVQHRDLVPLLDKVAETGERSTT
jgi:hypothetical protein